MKLSRKKNSIRNIKCGIINKIITIIFPFLTRTALIYTLGSEYLGLSSLFTAILQVLSLSELGIGSAMVFELYEPIAKNDTEKICKLQNLYRVIYKIIGTIILILGLCTMPFLKYFIVGNVPKDINIYVLYIIYLLNTSISYLLFSYKSSILSAYQRRDIILNIGTIIHICLYAIQLFCLFNYHNYYAYIIWLPIFTILENLIMACYVRKKYNKYKPKGKIEKKEFIRIIRKVKDLFGHKLSMVVTNSVDTIVISSFLGLNMVTIYNNYYYLMSAVSGVLDIIYQGILAGIGNSIVSEKKEKNEKDFKKFSFINSWIVSWCTICFICLYQPMISIWMGKEFLLSIDSVVLLGIYFWVWKIRQNILVYKDAAGMWEIDNKKPYIEIIVNLILNIILVKLIGINGVIISTIISMLFISLPWETKAFYKNYFNKDIKNYYKGIIKFAVITTIICIVTYSICNFIKIDKIIGFVVKILISIIIPNILFTMIFYNNEQFKKTFKDLRMQIVRPKETWKNNKQEDYKR